MLTSLSKSHAKPRKYLEIQRDIHSTDRKVKFVMYLFADGPKEYDFLLKILSLGRDGYWRDAIVGAAGPTSGSMVLDLACGTGLVTYNFAARGARVVGIDVTREMLVRASQLRTSRITDVDFIQARAENLPLRESSFDCATISLALRNVSSIAACLEEMGRCVKPGGRVISMDFTRPKDKVFRQFYYFYISQFLPLLGLIISRHWNGIFAYLANSIKRSMTPESISIIMRDTGLNQPSIRRMTHGVTALVSATK